MPLDQVQGDGLNGNEGGRIKAHGPDGAEAADDPACATKEQQEVRDDEQQLHPTGRWVFLFCRCQREDDVENQIIGETDSEKQREKFGLRVDHKFPEPQQSKKSPSTRHVDGMDQWLVNPLADPGD